MKKRSIRNSNNTSINTNTEVGNNTGESAMNSTAETESKGGKNKSKPYYSWW